MILAVQVLKQVYISENCATVSGYKPKITRVRAMTITLADRQLIVARMDKQFNEGKFELLTAMITFI